MDEEAKKKQEEADKIRCANFLLEMIVKYGPEVFVEHERKEKRKRHKAIRGKEVKFLAFFALTNRYFHDIICLDGNRLSER